MHIPYFYTVEINVPKEEALKIAENNLLNKFVKDKIYSIEIEKDYIENFIKSKKKLKDILDFLEKEGYIKILNKDKINLEEEINNFDELYNKLKELEEQNNIKLKYFDVEYYDIIDGYNIDRFVISGGNRFIGLFQELLNNEKNDSLIMPFTKDLLEKLKEKYKNNKKIYIWLGYNRHFDDIKEEDILDKEGKPKYWIIVVDLHY